MKTAISELAADFERALLLLDKQSASEIMDLAAAHYDMQTIIQSMIVEPLDRIGSGWQEGSMALSQIYMSGRICEDLIDKLLPQTAFVRKDMPRMAIAVLSDFHALGKRIVYSVLRASGFAVMDFGHGLSVDQVVRKAKEQEIEILFISVLMYASVLKVKELKSKLKGTQTQIMVGGAPFVQNPSLWRQVDADAYGATASDAVSFVKTYTKDTRR